ncbi:hypothetical protein P280DRAFT_547773 [Massarina eburnea CBS 473.64]|uniref:Uncharacterized protein n=1 Tax=Massarina eburnea CBS 473.64 TaxID=1395130 RepID=A0A6A6S361_9PLEO|nr:hypothetical protein P280DRAFT_547773 [Massarina eburnea CBS 473.64]
MRHSLEGTSSLVGGTELARRYEFSSFLTPPAPESSKSSIKSNAGPDEILKAKRELLKSSLKSHNSAPDSLAVKFSIPQRLPTMPGIEQDAPIPPPKTPKIEGRQSTSLPERRPSITVTEGRRSLNLPTASGLETIQIASPHGYRPLRSAVRPAFTKRISTPELLSRKESGRSSAPPASHSRFSSAQALGAGSRVTSFQSTASAPAVLLTTPTPEPSQPPSQYNPLEHYVPCEITKCKKHYTPSLLGPTFYSPQQSNRLVRKKGLCVYHANQDLRLAENKVKMTWESMRQNAGRKTLGMIAAEFEIWSEEVRDERTMISDELEKRQTARILGSPKTGKSKKNTEDNEWDWRYFPRPCTRNTCGKRWYSPYDNRLYLFYHMLRPSGLIPLLSLCPTCAKDDVEDSEGRMESRKLDGGASVEWKQWCEQFKKDRMMEQEYWEQTQEKEVKGNSVVFVSASSGGGKKKEKKKLQKVVEKGEIGGVAEPGKKNKKLGKLKDICVVM